MVAVADLWVDNQRDRQAQLEAELAEVRRQWGDSRDAFAARAVADRDEIERLTAAVNEQEKALLLQLQAGPSLSRRLDSSHIKHESALCGVLTVAVCRRACKWPLPRPRQRKPSISCKGCSLRTSCSRPA